MKRIAFPTAISVLLLALFACDEPVLPPQPVDIVARPGTAVVIPIDAPIKGEPAEALGYIPAFPRVDPNPLPQGLKQVRHTLGLVGSGRIIGNMLIEVPATARGGVSFTVSASGTGSAISGRSVYFSAQQTPVTVTVEGDPVAQKAPQLSGSWSAGADVWTFHPGSRRQLDITYPTGEKKTVRFFALPGSDGRWFLVDLDANGNTYWIDMDEDANTILVGHPGGEFDPYATLIR